MENKWKNPENTSFYFFFILCSCQARVCLFHFHFCTYHRALKLYAHCGRILKYVQNINSPFKLSMNYNWHSFDYSYKTFETFLFFRNNEYDSAALCTNQSWLRRLVRFNVACYRLKKIRLQTFTIFLKQQNRTVLTLIALIALIFTQISIALGGFSDIQIRSFGEGHPDGLVK